ncbi:MAG: hypothetical protein V4675_04080 [Verrucomicrobiota bacterium]
MPPGLLAPQFRRWCRCGVRDAVPALRDKQAKGPLRHVDGSYLKRHQHVLQGAKRLRKQEVICLSRSGLSTQLLAAADEAGHLCAFVLTSGNLRDQTEARRMMKTSQSLEDVQVPSWAQSRALAWLLSIFHESGGCGGGVWSVHAADRPSQS